MRCVSCIGSIGNKLLKIISHSKPQKGNIEMEEKILAFDQYQRYRTLSNICLKIKSYNQINILKILEVGANSQKNLGRMLKEEVIYYTDIDVPKGMENDPYFFSADATSLVGIDDNSYDVVIASDVFEHIPEQKRKAFIKELNRVAKYAAVICFPHNTREVANAEVRANEFFKSLCGSDYIWLKEHIQNGLPDCRKLETYLNEENVGYCHFTHGSLQIWERMMKNHFYCAQYEQLYPMLEKVDQYYNEEVYPKDMDKNNYRSFYIMFKDISKKDFYAQIVNDIFDFTEERNLEYTEIEHMSQELMQVAQMMFLQKIDKKINGSKRSAYYKQNELEIQCFFDRGNGFSEKDKMVIKPNGNNERTITIPVSANVKRVRIDPIVGEAVVVDNFVATGDEKIKINIETNGRIIGKKLIFTLNDPQIILFIPQKCSNIKISFGLICGFTNAEKDLMDDLVDSYVDSVTQYNELKKKYNKQEENLQYSRQEWNKLKNIYANVKNEKETYEQGYFETKQNYEAISNSEFWKATRPFRKAVTVLKKVGHRLLDSKNTECQEEKLQVEETIKFSVIIPLYNTPEKFLHEVIESIIGQTYSNWELCLGDASDKNCDQITSICMGYVNKYPEKIKYEKIENRGISENSNYCISMATGEYIALCDHDDVYLPDALKMNAIAIKNTDALVLYSDEEHLDVNEKRVNPFYKPNWSPDLLNAQMYTCHLFVFKRGIYDKVGGFRSEYDGSQDYDLMLRFSEVTDKICHIPEILYLWRESETSTASNKESKPYAESAGYRALQDHLTRKYGENAHAEYTKNTFVYETRYNLMRDKPLVSIIVPMKDGVQFSDKCIRSILENSTYQNYEIIILNNRSEKIETEKWFERIAAIDNRIKIVDADFEFNWSKLNNFGTRYANGEVYIFLNNDTVIITKDWIEKLCENALRKSIGVVGAQLLYEDGTIQHAGIVVGMSGWADHIFKGQEPVHYGSPYVSPMVTRNVTAVTGACMAISKEHFEILGKFKEEFIICGSDVELCLNAYKNGLYNLYNANVQLYHLESKSRDSYIPEVDYQLSYQYYKKYRENGDPFYNINLDINSTKPQLALERKKKQEVIRFMQVNWRADEKEDTKDHKVQDANAYIVGETLSIEPRESLNNNRRLNILVPSVDVKHVFGGIATALKFYDQLCTYMNIERRIIVTDSMVDPYSMVELTNYEIVEAMEDSDKPRQIVCMSDRYGKTLPVRNNDIFMTTAWWTTYIIKDVVEWQSEHYQNNMKPVVYFIQDYEPGFYPWSSRYLMADSTYRSELPMIAIFNSKLLYDFFKSNGYKFEQEYYFDPVLNERLKEVLERKKGTVKRKKQIMLYGRPSTQRNAFELIVESLQKWSRLQEDAKEWRIISAGEMFEDIQLENGIRIESVGKMSLEDYATMMLETKAAISLMVSPHPSYPPLEMATFGIKVITNAYGSKDLTSFSQNIISLKDCSSANIAKTLMNICQNEEDGVIDNNSDYYNGKDGWDEIISAIKLS